MSRNSIFRGLSSAAIYKRFVVLKRLLESNEKKFSKDLYQDMYGYLLQLDSEQIVRLHSLVESGETETVLDFLKKKFIKAKRTGRKNNAHDLKRQRKKRLRGK